MDMGQYKVYEIKQNIFKANDDAADVLRAEMKQNKCFMLNLMSSPGSGKTTTLTRTIEQLCGQMNIGIMEADIDSDVDAERISDTGVKKVIQLHTGGMCRLEWLEMSKTPYPQVFGSNLALYTETNYMAISGRLPVFEETDRKIMKLAEKAFKKKRWQRTNTATEPSYGAFSRITTWTSSCGCSTAGVLFLLPICCQWTTQI